MLQIYCFYLLYHQVLPRDESQSGTPPSNDESNVAKGTQPVSTAPGIQCSHIFVYISCPVFKIISLDQENYNQGSYGPCEKDIT